MNWLRNAWYAAAWSTEIADKPLGRTLLGEPVVFFRREDGGLAAIEGRCPHRFAPLAMGRCVAGTVECAYHGLRFDASGACVHNPHGDGKIPRAARVKAFRIEERWGLVWLWAGEDAKADHAGIPDLSHLARSDLGHIKGHMPLNAHYQLGVDNLIDLSHAQFVHGDQLMSDQFNTAEVVVEQSGNRVTNGMRIARSKLPLFYREFFPADTTEVEYWLDSTWNPPSIVTNDVGVTIPGASREEGARSFGVHIVTPETHNTAHYFFCHSRNRAIDDPAIDHKVREWQRVGFGLQDKPIIEASARMMGDEVDPLALRPVLLATDAAAVRARRVLAQMIRDEATPAQQSASSGVTRDLHSPT